MSNFHIIHYIEYTIIHKYIKYIAPTNTAFEALPEGTIDALLDPSNINSLQDILLYHVLPGAYPSSSLSPGTSSVTTLNEDDVTITVSEDGGVMVNNANVITADVMACNGVVHVVDTVLLPPPPTEEEVEEEEEEDNWWGGATSPDDTDDEWQGGSGSKTSKTNSGSGSKSAKKSSSSADSKGSKTSSSDAKSSKTNQDSKSAKHGKTESGEEDDDWWAGGGSEGEDDDWWSGGGETPGASHGPSPSPTPCGKAGKECPEPTPIVPSMSPTPCGKAGKECDEGGTYSPSHDGMNVGTTPPQADGTDPPVVSDSVPQEATLPPAVPSDPPIAMQTTAPPSVKKELVPITSAPVSPPPSSGWPTWAPTNMPSPTIQMLQSSGGTWFQSGKAYDVEMSQYRASSNVVGRTRVNDLDGGGYVRGSDLANGSGGGNEDVSSATMRYSLGCVMMLVLGILLV